MSDVYQALPVFGVAGPIRVNATPKGAGRNIALQPASASSAGAASSLMNSPQAPRGAAGLPDTYGSANIPMITVSPGGAATVALHPWAIYSSNDENGNIAIVKIEYNSKVYQDTGSFDIYPVTGLDAWVPIQVGYVTLEASITSGVIDEIIILWGDDGSLPRAQWDVNDNQTVCRIRLGYIYQDENGGWAIRQDVYGQLTLINTCSDGKSTYCFFQT